MTEDQINYANLAYELSLERNSRGFVYNADPSVFLYHDLPE